jgi:hypothetical protein
MGRREYIYFLDILDVALAFVRATVLVLIKTREV